MRNNSFEGEILGKSLTVTLKPVNRERSEGHNSIAKRCEVGCYGTLGTGREGRGDEGRENYGKGSREGGREGVREEGRKGGREE